MATLISSRCASPAAPASAAQPSSRSGPARRPRGAGFILLTNPADFAALNEEYARWFPSGPPTRYVAKLGVELPGCSSRSG
jgi:hypothetical protein